MKRIVIFLIALLVIAFTVTFSACSFDADSNDNKSNAAEKETLLEFEEEILNNTENTAEVGADNSEEETTDLFSRVDILLKASISGLSVRSAPNSTSSVIGSLDKGDLVAFMGEENGWYTTVYKEKRGYVSAKYCEVLQFSKGEDRIEKVIEEGKKLLGYPYVWGSQRYHWGNGILNTAFVEGKYDCSALMQYIFYKTDKTLLGVTSREQAAQVRKLDRASLQRGDLMFFTNSSRKNLTGIERVGHVGLYLGNNYILHTASDYACIEEISATRWSYFMWGGRV